jgi:hypothetical protein
MAGHMGVKGVCLMLGKRNTKGSMLGLRWKPEAARECFCSSGDFKTYDNLCGGGGPGDSHPIVN